MQLSDAQLKLVYAHAAETYPRECFGFLVGSRQAGGRVCQVVRGSNLRTDRPDRFEMDAGEFLLVGERAETAGMEIIGFYHSHPDWPPVPSQADIELAWPDSYYLIVSIHAVACGAGYDAHPLGVAAWVLSDDAPSRFVQVPLELLGNDA
jgi:proteasome lid subunit RPN8/RPN11